jgi:hypothetical protein
MNKKTKPTPVHKCAPSNAHTPPINLQMTARHKLTIITRQKRHHTRHIIRMPKPTQRRLLLQLLQLLLAPAILETRAAVDDGSVDGVYTDGVFAEFLSGGECDAAEREFGRRVGDEAGEADEAGDGGAEYDGAACALVAEDGGDVFEAEEGCCQARVSYPNPIRMNGGMVYLKLRLWS